MIGYLKFIARVFGENRVIRGGSWGNNARNCRSAYRNRNHPGNQWNNLGFRLAAAHPLSNTVADPARVAWRPCVVRSRHLRR